MKRLCSIVLLLLTLFPVFDCTEKPNQSYDETTINDYVVEISGTDGFELDMLLISKPSAGSLEREVSKIKIPYTQRLKAYKCAVWIDAEYRETGGSFTMIFVKNGIIQGRANGDVKQDGEKFSRFIGDL
jgi:hypothetical protein